MNSDTVMEVLDNLRFIQTAIHLEMAGNKGSIT